MSIKKKLIVGVSIFLLGCVALHLSLAYGGCGLDREFARSRVIKQHFDVNGVREKFLTYDEKRSSYCNVAFIYENGSSKIYYSVINYGKVTWWDVEERGEL